MKCSPPFVKASTIIVAANFGLTKKRQGFGNRWLAAYLAMGKVHREQRRYARYNQINRR
jgi:hypothetical protein